MQVPPAGFAVAAVREFVAQNAGGGHFAPHAMICTTGIQNEEITNDW